MSNMSYCRFENTHSDLVDCEVHITDKIKGDYEPYARVLLVETCADILEALGFEVTDGTVERRNLTREIIEAAITDMTGDPGNEDNDEEA